MTLPKSKQAEKEKEREEQRKELEEKRIQLKAQEDWKREHPDEIDWSDEKFESYLGPLPKDAEIIKEKIAARCADRLIGFVQDARWLLYLKKITPRGEWEKYKNEECPYRPRFVEQIMKLAIWEDKHPHLRSEWPRLRKLDKTHLFTLFGPLEEIAEGIITGDGPKGFENLDAYSAMNYRKLREENRKLLAEKRKGQEQILKGDKINRQLRAENKAVKIGPQTDLDYMKLMQELQMTMIEVIGRMASGANQPKTAAQRRAQIGTILHIEKQAALLAHDLQTAYDPTEDLSDAEREIVVQTRPDGINWFDLTVFNFLEEATRKANADQEIEGEIKSDEETESICPGDLPDDSAATRKRRVS